MITQFIQSDKRTAPLDGLSYVRGSTNIPLSDATIWRFLDETVSKFSDHPAIIFREQNIRWTWRQFAEQVDILASGLLGLGVNIKDRVGIWSANRFEWLLTQFATARIGAILVNINQAYLELELEYALNKVDCKVLILSPHAKASKILQSLAPELIDSQPGALSVARLPHLRVVIRMGGQVTPGMFRFQDVMAQGRESLDISQLNEVEARLAAQDPINIQFTSGTTGHPKGATLTHHNIVNNARYSALAINLKETDSLCIPLPLYHCMGMVLSVLVCVSTGATMVFPGEIFDAEATLSAISEERCSAVHGVPTMFITELGHPHFDRYDLGHLRTGIMAGAIFSVETIKRIVSKMHMNQITIAYGMTETSPLSFQSDIADPIDKLTTTVGRIHPHLEVKIVNKEGKIVPLTEIGELCTRGYSVMRGYWADEKATNKAIIDGWMHSGDLATIDIDGYCSIVGRLTDMLIRGGENIYPREVEDILFRAVR
ncbi:AMP-binding protein [Candidatus Fukatsuia endosymbiont of Tuberolachnus salignus]|uniref:AMP-binding protein n=1 Tax=Candidatus Fukatsuia endosymbiont of Tuberolachnus salignus TaxID=3077957 RepID=UPI00313E4764